MILPRSVWNEVGAPKCTIPLRSTDLDPIKNIFLNVKQRLNQDTLDQQITREDFAAFFVRVKTTLESIPTDEGEKTILSLGMRIHQIIKHKRQRVKY